MRKIENRNWSGNITPENIEDIYWELRKMESEGDFTVITLTIAPTGEYDLQVSVGETIKVQLNKGVLAIDTHNFVNCVGKHAFFTIQHDRFSIKQESSAGNHLHWEFVRRLYA